MGSPRPFIGPARPTLSQETALANLVPVTLKICFDSSTFAIFSCCDDTKSGGGVPEGPLIGPGWDWAPVGLLLGSPGLLPIVS